MDKLMGTRLTIDMQIAALDNASVSSYAMDAIRNGGLVMQEINKKMYILLIDMLKFHTYLILGE